MKESAEDPALSAKRKAYLTQKLSAARERLQYINTALKKLIAINTKERAELEKWTADIDKAYDESLNRVWEALNDLLLDAAPDALQKNYSDALSTIDAVNAAWLKGVVTETDPRKLAEFKNGIESLENLKGSLGEANKLTKNYQDTKLYYDVDKGDMKANDTDEQLKRQHRHRTAHSQPGTCQEGIGLNTDQTNGKESRLFQFVVHVGKATNYVCGFFGDVMRQQFVWKPLMEQLQNNLVFNQQGMEKLRLSAAQTSQAIDCLEKLLR